MKISVIRNTLIKQTIIALGIVGVFVGVVMYLDSFDEEYDRNINMLKSQSDGIMQQVNNLSLEYSKVVNNMVMYGEIKQKQEGKLLMVSKAALRDAIAGAREKYYIDNLDVKMDEIKALSGDKYKRPTAFIESSNTTINLNGLTDLEIFGLIKTLQQTFLGIKFTYFKFGLGTNFDNATLVAIKDTGSVPIVNTNIKFTLFGLRSVAADDKDLLESPDKGQPGFPEGHERKNLIRLRQR